MSNTRRIFGALLLLSAAGGARMIFHNREPEGLAAAGSRSASLESRPRVRQTLAEMPLSFIENRGQLDPRVAYLVAGRDQTLYFARDGITLAFADGSPDPGPEPGFQRASLHAPRKELAGGRYVLKLDFLDSNPDVRVSGESQTPAVINYFRGARADWKTGVATYASVRYRDLWPGIDLVYSGTVNRLKYTFVVRPGADPKRIRLAYRGATGLRTGEDGMLQIATPLGLFHDDVPRSYQQIRGNTVAVPSSYALDAAADADGGRRGHGYGFAVGSYDSSQPLVIDPAVFVYSGFIGGAGADYGAGIAVDREGNVYVAGSTSSSQSTFPVAVGPDLSQNGFSDAFVAKVKFDGTGLVYAGYIGGAADDFGAGVAVDAVGNAYVTGFTSSDEATFPVIVGPRLLYSGGRDAFVAKVSAGGTALEYCGYVGGSSDDRGSGIAVDASGSAYVTGYTASPESSFPVTVGPQLSFNGGFDAFVGKVKADGSGFDYLGYLGGAGVDHGYGVAVDPRGQAYVVGDTSSKQDTFPVTIGPALVYNGGTSDAFVAKIRADGTGLVYAGYVGGNNLDAAFGVAVDSRGRAFLTGDTYSTECTFPVRVGPSLVFAGGLSDAFVAEVRADGIGLVYAGYIGGGGAEAGNGIAVDADDNAYVTGYTTSSETTFPVLGGPDLFFQGGPGDGFVAKIRAGGAALDYCGYIGGTGDDAGAGIAVDADGHPYVTGYTLSSETTFRTTLGPDLTSNGSYDAFVAKIDENGIPTPTPISTLTATRTLTPFGQYTRTSTRTGTPTSTRTFKPTCAASTPTKTRTPTRVPTNSTPTSTPTKVH